ncbi:MAG: hypothetical protein ACK55X_08660 [Synechococcaceae cyanobacterium]
MVAYCHPHHCFCLRADHGERQRLVRRGYIPAVALTVTSTSLRSVDDVALASFVTSLAAQQAASALAAEHAPSGRAVIRSGKFVPDVSGVRAAIGAGFVGPCAPLVAPPVTLSAYNGRS